uniref:Uncharacterized protein n=1 Tax=Glossina austeni TaxID=7395 RepID=A0A1A9UXS1_GLOAU
MYVSVPMLVPVPVPVPMPVAVPCEISIGLWLTYVVTTVDICYCFELYKPNVSEQLSNFIADLNRETEQKNRNNIRQLFGGDGNVGIVVAAAAVVINYCSDDNRHDDADDDDNDENNTI